MPYHNQVKTIGTIGDIAEKPQLLIDVNMSQKMAPLEIMYMAT